MTVKDKERRGGKMTRENKEEEGVKRRREDEIVRWKEKEQQTKEGNNTDSGSTEEAKSGRFEEV